MPPRFAFWTIIIDNAPTAFRAKERDDLLPTLRQLRRTNKDVALKWFAGGRLWESQEDARRERLPASVREPREKAWRPGGEHRDPRARFAPKAGRPPRDTPRRGEERPRGPAATKPWDQPGRPPGGKPKQPWEDRRPGRPEASGTRPGSGKPPGRWSGKPKGRADWQPRDDNRGATRAPTSNRPPRPWQSKPKGKAYPPGGGAGSHGRAPAPAKVVNSGGEAGGRKPRRWALPQDHDGRGRPVSGDRGGRTPPHPHSTNKPKPPRPGGR
jgi:hypothetical protein